MKTKFAWAGMMALLLLAAGCQKQSTTTGAAATAAQPAVAAPKKPGTVELVPETERSKHFAAVNRYLELGGTLYGYIDVDGDPLKIAGHLQMIAGQIAAAQPMAAPFLKQDFAQIFSILGFNDIKAVGLSSVPAATGGFRNRAFFYMPEGRHGLFAGLGGPPAPFSYVKMAPADVDLYGEGEVDVPAVYAAVKAVVAKVAGDATVNQLEAKLKEAGKPAGFSAYDLIQSFKGKSVTILRLDPERTMTIPAKTPFVIPSVSLLIRVDGIGGALQNALAKLPMLEHTQEGALQIYAAKAKLPIEGLQPVVAIEGTALYLATTREFLLECQQRKAGLDQNPDFQRALAEVGREGNALAYVSPRLVARLKQLGEMNPQAAPETRRMLSFVASTLPVLERPVVTLRINQPDGILVRSMSYRSLKQDVACLAIYNPVTIGVMAAMAIPAFQKVRQASQDKAITNNLRQLGAAADQYYLENGMDSTTYSQLVGPDKYVKMIVPVAGENYRVLKFKQGQPLRVRTADGRMIEYKP
jgi:type IV pilus assembly protein PilA